MVFNAKRFKELSAKVNSFSAEQIERIDAILEIRVKPGSNSIELTHWDIDPIVNLKKGVNYSDDDIRKILAKIYTDFDISTLRYDPDGPHPGSTSFIFKPK